jgi:ribosome biogenesis GTPase A
MFRSPDRLKEFLLEAIKLLEEVCSKYGKTEKVERLKKLKERLESPFLITVFGEVNAGKSSFLNALLGIPDLCRTDVDICTDRITVIRYSDKPYRREIDGITEEVGVDNTLLKGFTIVDTPGINSVLEHHTYITEKFLPSSDVILVVIPATNPHTKPIWDWVERIGKEFGRKLIFILQQKDLVPPQGLEKLVKRVRQYAAERGVRNPKVFPVSALFELKGKSSESGFEPLRKFLNERYTGPVQLLIKYETVRDELVNLYSECVKELELLRAEAERIKGRLEEVAKILERNRKSAIEYKNLLLQTVDNEINRLADKVSREIESLSLLDLTIRRSNVKRFLSRLKAELEEELKNFVERTLFPKMELFETAVLRPAVEEAAKRLEEFKRFYEKLGKREPPLRGEEVLLKFERSIDSIDIGGEKAVAIMGGSLVAGSLLALLGGSFAVDITGGIISAIGITLGSLYLLNRKRNLERRLKEIFQKELGERLKKEITRAVEERLSQTLGVMEGYLHSRIETLKKEIEEINLDREKLLKKLSELKKLDISLPEDEKFKTLKE